VHELRFDAIGTGWCIETVAPIESRLEAAVQARIAEFDATWSRFRDDSLVSTVAANPGTHSFPDDAAPLFALYDELFLRTGGAVTPLVGRGLEQLGYDSEYSLVPRGPSVAAADWPTEVRRAGTTVSTSSPVLIDVGAAGKGYLVDLVGEVLRAGGVDDYLIDASGDLLIAMPEGRRVGLEHPFDPSLAIGVVTVNNASICASGSNRRVWGNGLHHILDGRTGKPTRDVIATWAIAESAMVADGLATALFFASPTELADAFEFEWVRMFESGRAEHSSGLPGELFR
jgi:thiamine biosynthesis lipoprotein